MKRAILVLACGIGLLVLGAPASARPLQEGFFTLTVHVDGEGTVTSSPSGIDCPDECSADFEGFSEVVLTAEAAPGWTFVGWEGCSTAPPGYRQSAAAETCTVFMDGAQDVTATFEQTSYTLRVHLDGKGTVTSSPGGIDCPKDCSSDFDADTQGRAHGEARGRLDVRGLGRLPGRARLSPIRSRGDLHRFHGPVERGDCAFQREAEAAVGSRGADSSRGAELHADGHDHRVRVGLEQSRRNRLWSRLHRVLLSGKQRDARSVPERHELRLMGR